MGDRAWEDVAVLADCVRMHGVTEQVRARAPDGREQPCTLVGTRAGLGKETKALV